MEKRMRDLRKALGLTLNEFGSKIGLRGSTVSEMERGNSAVTERTVSMILAAFPRVSETWLRTGEGEMFRQEDSTMTELISRLDLPDITNTLLDVYEELPEEARAIVLEYAHKVITDLMAKAGANAAAADPDQADEDLKQGILDQIAAEKSRAARSVDSPSGATGTA